METCICLHLLSALISLLHSVWSSIDCFQRDLPSGFCCGPWQWWAWHERAGYTKQYAVPSHVLQALVSIVATETEREASWSRLEGLLLHWACSEDSSSGWNLPPTGWSSSTKATDAGGQLNAHIACMLCIFLVQIPNCIADFTTNGFSALQHTSTQKGVHAAHHSLHGVEAC